MSDSPGKPRTTREFRLQVAAVLYFLSRGGLVAFLLLIPGLYLLRGSLDLPVLIVAACLVAIIFVSWMLAAGSLRCVACSGPVLMDNGRKLHPYARTLPILGAAPVTAWHILTRPEFHCPWCHTRCRMRKRWDVQDRSGPVLMPLAAAGVPFLPGMPEIPAQTSPVLSIRTSAVPKETAFQETELPETEPQPRDDARPRATVLAEPSSAPSALPAPGSSPFLNHPALTATPVSPPAPEPRRPTDSMKTSDSPSFPFPSAPAGNQAPQQPDWLAMSAAQPAGDRAGLFAAADRPATLPVASLRPTEPVLRPAPRPALSSPSPSEQNLPFSMSDPNGVPTAQLSAPPVFPSATPAPLQTVPIAAAEPAPFQARLNGTTTRVPSVTVALGANAAVPEAPKMVKLPLTALEDLILSLETGRRSIETAFSSIVTQLRDCMISPVAATVPVPAPVRAQTVPVESPPPRAQTVPVEAAPRAQTVPVAAPAPAQPLPPLLRVTAPVVLPTVQTAPVTLPSAEPVAASVPVPAPVYSPLPPITTAPVPAPAASLPTIASAPLPPLFQPAPPAAASAPVAAVAAALPVFSQAPLLPPFVPAPVPAPEPASAVEIRHTAPVPAAAAAPALPPPFSVASVAAAAFPPPPPAVSAAPVIPAAPAAPPALPVSAPTEAAKPRTRFPSLDSSIAAQLNSALSEAFMPAPAQRTQHVTAPVPPLTPLAALPPVAIEGPAVHAPAPILAAAPPLPPLPLQAVPAELPAAPLAWPPAQAAFPAMPASVSSPAPAAAPMPMLVPATGAAAVLPPPIAPAVPADSPFRILNATPPTPAGNGTHPFPPVSPAPASAPQAPAFPAAAVFPPPPAAAPQQAHTGSPFTTAPFSPPPAFPASFPQPAPSSDTVPNVPAPFSFLKPAATGGFAPQQQPVQAQPQAWTAPEALPEAPAWPAAPPRSSLS